jgi:prophage regulatory protein
MPKNNTTIARFLRQKQVLELIPFSKSTLWLRVSQGTFPKPVKLSERVTVWRESDIQAFIAAAGV